MEKKISKEEIIENKIEQAVAFRAKEENTPQPLFQSATTKTVSLTPEPKRRFTTEELKRMRDADSEIVNGRFIFHECRGGKLEIYLKLYAGDDITKYEFQDGEVYSIPKFVARHLRNNGWYPIHKFTEDVKGNKVQSIGKKVRRFDFESVEFVDLDNEQDKKILLVNNNFI